MKFKTSDGLALYYDISGKGAPCLFLHGGPGYWSKSFQHFAGDLLEENLQMIYLDQRGCGRSEHSPIQDYSLERVVEDIEALRIHLGIEEWWIIGHSFGGLLAVNYASKFPNRMKGMILSNVTLHMLASFKHQIIRGASLLKKDVPEIDTLSLESFIKTYYEILTSLLENEVYFSFQYSDLEMKKEVDLIDQDGLESDPNFQQFVFSSKDYFRDFSLITSAITNPVLIIVGENDHAVGPIHHQLFQFKNKQVSIIKGSHHPYIENQAEFKETILNFVCR
ncbi:hypothetical protein OBCHQ24_06765 [Oceanobacillus iheyensis]|nr:hypothetical protein OBCHQ24_06765 [Oceanobacillus iheyensis]